MRGKEEKKGRGKEEKKRRKGGKQLGTKSQKKQKELRAHLFPLRSRHFLDQLEIGALKKSTLYLLLFSCKIFFFFR